MTEQRLRGDLERLRAEINRSAGKDADVRRKLNDLIDEIESRTGDPEAGSDGSDLVSRVRQAIGNFETEHPRATAILNDILVTLGNMGI